MLHSHLREVRVPISAVDSISPAFQHAKEQLFRPFRFGQWTRLALVGFFAGELSSGGACNFNIPSTTGPRHHDLLVVPNLDSALLIPLVIVAIIAIPLLWLLFLYVSSRMRFVLFDSIIAKNCSVRRMWRARRGPGLQYFVWQIVLSLVALAGVAFIVGVPAVIAFLLGWFTQPSEHLAGLILAGVLVFFVFFGWTLLTLLVHVFTKDFVVPQMALENLSAFDGWAKLITMLEREKGRYAGYAGMKLVMAIAAAIAVGIMALILILVPLVPIGGLGVVSILVGQAAGLTWNVFTITLAVVAGCILLLVLLYGMSLISVPVIVFFPAYSIHFFAARYPLLANLLYPPAPPPAPPVPPAPEPIR
jgi:hypothetical protein